MPAPETIFYDGRCGLCHRTVRFMLRRDPPWNGDANTPAPRFHFAPLDSEAFRAAVPAEVRGRLPDSVIVRTRDGRLLARSSAVIHVLRQLGGGWRLVGGLLWLVPQPLRDLGYVAIASVRRKLFAAPAGACPLVPPELRVRFHR